MLLPFFNNGATMDMIPRGEEVTAAPFVPHRAKRGFGLSWLGPFFLTICRWLNG